MPSIAPLVNAEALFTWIGCKVFDAHSRTVGELAGYYQDGTGAPRWLAVFETESTVPGIRLVPMSLVVPDAAAPDVTVGAPAQVVFDSPVHDPGDSVSVQDERLLLRYYGLDPDATFNGDGSTAEGVSAVRCQRP